MPLNGVLAGKGLLELLEGTAAGSMAAVKLARPDEARAASLLAGRQVRLAWRGCAAGAEATYNGAGPPDWSSADPGLDKAMLKARAHRSPPMASLFVAIASFPRRSSCSLLQRR